MESLVRAQIQAAPTTPQLEGWVLHADRQGLRVKIEAPQETMPPLGSKVLVRLLTQRGVYQVPVTVSAYQQGELRLLFRGEVKCCDQRQYRRYPYQMEIEWRAAERDKAFPKGGEWRSGIGVDIGRGGMRLLVEPDVEVPDYLEVRFWLVGHFRRIQTFAQVVHHQQGVAGQQLIGVSFDKMARVDQEWLRRVFP